MASATGRGIRVPVSIDLVTEDCCNCHVLFAFPEDLKRKRLEDGSTFYCPNGHAQHYTGETMEQMRKRLEREAANAKADRDWYEEQLRGTERSRNALRGVVTRQRNRAIAGSCPFGCRRHFTNLQRHVASKHPGEKLEGEE